LLSEAQPENALTNPSTQKMCSNYAQWSQLTIYKLRLTEDRMPALVFKAAKIAVNDIDT
jgi:CRISPR/Cas system-associated endoribonuclease Cas2